MLAAARTLAGLDQAQLAELAGVSASTISNAESSTMVREETLKAIRKALRSLGISHSIDRTNGLVMVAARFEEPDDDD